MQPRCSAQIIKYEFDVFSFFHSTAHIRYCSKGTLQDIA
jgi:hypothetical protein